MVLTLCYSYYTGTLPGRPGERHLLSVNSNNKSHSHCLTCPGHQDLSSPDCLASLDCHYSHTILAPDLSAYILHCLGPEVPSSHLFSLPDNKCIRTLDTNQALRSVVSTLSIKRNTNWILMET